MGGSKAEAPQQDMLPQFRDAGWTLGWTVDNALKNNRLNTYGGDWVANMTGGQNAAIDKITQMGLGGNSQLNAATGLNTDTLQGKYLDQGNPYLSGAMDAGMQAVNRQLASQFGGSGMSGSPAHLQYASEAYSNAAAPLYMQNYQAERDLQNQAVGRAPLLDQAMYFGPQQALAAQGQLQAQSQAEIDAERQAYDLQRSEPFRRAQAASAALGQGMGTTGMYGGSEGSSGAGAGALGGAASGAMMGTAVMPGWGTAIGAGLGAAGGAYANK